MKIIDNGHEYSLSSLDGGPPIRLVFVKREGEGYPGNVGHHPGTTMQEVLRALVERATYVNNQIPCEETTETIYLLKQAIFLLESRAAKRHGRSVDFNTEQAVHGPTCYRCGHVGCVGECH